MEVAGAKHSIQKDHRASQVVFGRSLPQDLVALPRSLESVSAREQSSVPYCRTAAYQVTVAAWGTASESAADALARLIEGRVVEES